MSILPKKQKEKVILQLAEKMIEVMPSLLEILVLSIIGTCLGWNPILIVTAITAIAGSNTIIAININNDSKKD